MQASVKRLRRTPEEARRLILDTAQDLIARSGPEGLRLQEIAAAAGISHPLILHHFGSREGLVRALVQQAVDELRDKLIPAMRAAEWSLEQEFDEVFDAYRDGLAQRLAWLATIDPTGEAISPAAVMRDIADSLHAMSRMTAAGLIASPVGSIVASQASRCAKPSRYASNTSSNSCSRDHSAEPIVAISLSRSSSTASCTSARTSPSRLPK